MPFYLLDVERCYGTTLNLKTPALETSDDWSEETCSFELSEPHLLWMSMFSQHDIFSVIIFVLHDSSSLHSLLEFFFWVKKKKKKSFNLSEILKLSVWPFSFMSFDFASWIYLRKKRHSLYIIQDRKTSRKDNQDARCFIKKSRNSLPDDTISV